MFGSDELVHLDFETLGRESDLKALGTYAYATTASAIVCAFAVGDAPAQSWHADGAILDWDHAPPDLRAAFERGAIFAAWHATSTPRCGITARSDFRSCRRNASLTR